MISVKLYYWHQTMGSLFSKIVINSKHPIMSKPWGFIDTFSKEEAPASLMMMTRRRE